MRLLSIRNAYLAKYGRPLEFEQFGYTSSSMFILEHLMKDYRVAKTETLADFRFYSRTPQELEELKQCELKTKQLDEEQEVKTYDENAIEERKSKYSIIFAIRKLVF